MFGVRNLESIGMQPVLIAWWWTLLFQQNTLVWQSDRQTPHHSIYRRMHMHEVAIHCCLYTLGTRAEVY